MGRSKLTQKDHYDLTKEMLFAKFEGCCAFCGSDLGKKWHIWHIKPKNTIITDQGDLIFGDDSYDNKLPACISCESTRTHNSPSKEAKIDIEQFRQALYEEYDFLKNHSMAKTYFQKAVRYGLIKETGKDIVFHFEKP